MKGRLLAALAVTGLWFCGFVGVFAQSGRAPVEGVWELRDLTYPKPPATPVVKPAGMMIFSGNHYALIYLTTSDRPPLTGPTANATADQLRAAWGPLTASSGTFQISGNTLTARPKVAKNPPAMASGAFIENTFTLKGDSLTLTSVKNDQGAIANPLTAHWVRAK